MPPDKGNKLYPFPIFGQGWEKALPSLDELPFKGDTMVGSDVWIGYEALVLPGVHIGSGAIIAARAVVTRDVPAYAVVGGNPARVLRMRFPDETIARLEKLAWWDWPAEKITKNLEAIMGGDVEKLERAK